MATSLLKRPRRSVLGLVEALATPHGIDRYLELIHPMLTVRELRAVVTDVEHSTTDSVTLDPAPDPAVEGFRGRPVRPAHRRHRRCAPHPLLLAVVLAVPRRRLHRADDQGPPRGCGVQLPARPRRARAGGRAGAGRRRLPPAGRASRAGAADQRRQRHHAGAVDAAHAVRRGLPRRHRLPALRVHRGRRRLPASSCAGSPAEHDNVRLVLAYTKQQTGGDLHGLFDETHLAEAAPWYAHGADLPVRAARADGHHPRALRRQGHRGHAALRGVRDLAGSRPPTARSPARPTSAAPSPRTPARPCSSRPRPPGSRPSTAAAWASASPARRSRPPAAPATSRPARRTPTPTPRSSCASRRPSATSPSTSDRLRHL